jgi:hypothetical protein
MAIRIAGRKGRLEAKRLEENFSFPRTYEATILEELPGSGAVRHFPGLPNDSAAGRDGLIVETRALDRHPWIGVFEFGSFGVPYSGIFGTPDPRRLIVVAQGRGFLVDTQRQSAKNLAVDPVTTVVPIAEADVVLVADPFDIAAYDRQGLRWTTNRLSADGLTIVGASPSSVEVDVIDSYSRAPTRLVLAPRTGAILGRSAA